MVCENHDDELALRFDEPETQRQASAALENIALQFPNAEPAVDVRIAKCLPEIKQREHGSDFFRVGSCAQLFLHGRG